LVVAEGSRPDKTANTHVSLAASGRSLNAFQVLHHHAPTQAAAQEQKAMNRPAIGNSVPSPQEAPADSEDAQEVVPTSQNVPSDPQDTASQSKDEKEEEDDAEEGEQGEEGQSPPSDGDSVADPPSERSESGMVEEKPKITEADKKAKSFAWTHKGVEWASQFFKDDEAKPLSPKSGASLQPEQVAQLVAAMGKDDFDDDDIAQGLENGYIVKAQAALSPASATIASSAPVAPKPVQKAPPPHAILQSKLSSAQSGAQATPQAGQVETARQPTQTALQKKFAQLGRPAWMVKIAGFFSR